LKGLVIFDVGGVLRDSSLVLWEGYKRGFEVLGLKFGFTERQVWKLRGVGKYNNGIHGAKALFAISKTSKKIDEMLRAKDSEELIDKVVEENVSYEDLVKVETIGRIYREFFNSDGAADKIRIFPDAKSSVEKLRKSGYELAIFSNASKSTIKRDIAALGLDNFAEILAEDDIIKKKPSGEGIIKIIYRLNSQLETTYYVGDAPTDIMAAKDAKCKSIALLTGMGGRKNLEAEKPDLIFDDLTSMTNYLIGR